MGLGDRLRARVRAKDVPAIRALLGDVRGKAMLDVGGGTGVVAAMVAPGAQVTVVEPHPKRRAQGQRARPHMAFLDAGAEALPLPDASFEAALALLSLHHVGPQEQALAEVRRVLRPGGVLVVQELSPHHGLGRMVRAVEGLVGRLHALAHGHGADHAPAFRGPEEWAASLRQAGFREVAIHAAPRGFLLRALR
jgi:ubiquinone/menaquinone biosynthesis C-methylase UbiE